MKAEVGLGSIVAPTTVKTPHRVASTHFVNAPIISPLGDGCYRCDKNYNKRPGWFKQVLEREQEQETKKQSEGDRE